MRTYHEACRRVELPRRRFHDLRHSAATIAIEAGADIYAVGRMLLHASISTTANVYGHVTLEMKRKTAALMEAALG